MNCHTLNRGDTRSFRQVSISSPIYDTPVMGKRKTIKLLLAASPLNKQYCAFKTHSWGQGFTSELVTNMWALFPPMNPPVVFHDFA